MKLVIHAERVYGSGCDYVIIEDLLIHLIEIKSCNLGINDADDAIRQIGFTEGKLREEGVAQRRRMERLVIHEKGGGCKTYALAQILLENKGIKLFTTSSPEGKKLYDQCKRGTT